MPVKRYRMHVQRGCGSPAGHAPGLAESRSS